MNWIFDIDVRKEERGYVIIPSVKQSPRAGVFGKAYPLHSTWEKAFDAFKEEILVQHSDGDLYTYDGISYDDPQKLFEKIKEHHNSDFI